MGLTFFENENVTQHSYKKTLRYFAFPRLRNYPQNMLFQQDGASIHYDDLVTLYLNRKIPYRSIGRGGQNSWPLWSPEFYLCDYILWSYLKDIECWNSRNTLEELKSNITDAIRSFDASILEKYTEIWKNSYLSWSEKMEEDWEFTKLN